MGDVADSNREHFNKNAKKYEEHPLFAILQPKIAKALTGRLDWLGFNYFKSASSASGSSNGDVSSRVRVLDYACGTGLVSHVLASYAHCLHGIDISSGMVSIYNDAAPAVAAKVTDHKVQMAAVEGNLFDATNPTPSLTDPNYAADSFDLAIISMALHHLSDPALAVKRLAERVKPGVGVVCVIDFARVTSAKDATNPSPSHDEDVSVAPAQVNNVPKGVAETIAVPDGFREADVRSLFEKAGCAEEFKYEVLEGSVELPPGMFSDQDGQEGGHHSHGHGHGHAHHQHGGGNEGEPTFLTFFIARGTRSKTGA